MGAFVYREDSGWEEALRATTMTAAVQEAEALLLDGDWDASGGTIWPQALVVQLDDDGDEVDRQWVRVTVDPDEPPCEDADGHDWQSPHEVVGGLKENPGVTGHGGGVVITEVCSRCGVYRERDTWASDPSTGEEGLDWVSYRHPDGVSEAYRDRLAAETRAAELGQFIRTPESLDQLQEALLELDGLQQYMAQGVSVYEVAGVDPSDLPTFGGQAPSDTGEVFSWDAGRLLVSGWDIVDRDTEEQGS